MALILKNRTSLRIGTMSERAAVDHGGTTTTTWTSSPGLGGC